MLFIKFTGDSTLDQDFIKAIVNLSISDFKLIISGKLHQNQVKALCHFIRTNNTVQTLQFDEFILPDSAIPDLCMALNQNTTVTSFALNNVTTEQGKIINDYKLNNGKTVDGQLRFIQDGNLCIQNRNSTKEDKEALAICTTRGINPPLDLRIDIDNEEHFKKLEGDLSPDEFNKKLLTIPKQIQNHERIQRQIAVTIFGGTHSILTHVILTAANLEYSKLSQTLKPYDQHKLVAIKQAIDAFKKHPQIITATDLANALNNVKNGFSNDDESSSLKNVKLAVSDAQKKIKAQTGLRLRD